MIKYNHKQLTWFRILTYQIRVKPNFIIIGGQRCGTTSLFNYLSRHPNIISPIKKEIHFFDLNYKKKMAWYRAHFPSLSFMIYKGQRFKRNFLTFEASPYYIFHPAVPKRIFETIPNIKLIALLRNPIDRAYSHYQHEVRLGYETLSFEEATDREAERLDFEPENLIDLNSENIFRHQHFSYLSRGIYSEQLKRWLILFPKENLLIVKSEDLFNEPRKVLKKIFSFLNISEWNLKNYDRHNHLKYPKMNSSSKKNLLNYFSQYNHSLYNLVGTKFNWD